MRFVIRKAKGFGNLFLTPSHRWGRLDKARTFTQRQARQVAEALTTNGYGVFDLTHARQMVQDEPQAQASHRRWLVSRLLESVKPRLKDSLLVPGQTHQAIVPALGPFTVKDAWKVNWFAEGRGAVATVNGYDVISDRALINCPTLGGAEAACRLLNTIHKETRAMSDRFPGAITIGGSIPRRLLDLLAEMVATESVSIDWQYTLDKTAIRVAIEEAAARGETVRFTDDEAVGGMFEELEGWLTNHGIDFDRHSDARYEWDAENVRPRPERARRYDCQPIRVRPVCGG